MASRRPPRRSALKIASGEFRGAVSSSAALVGAWRDGAGEIVRPIRRIVKRTAKRYGRGTASENDAEPVESTTAPFSPLDDFDDLDDSNVEPPSERKEDPDSAPPPPKAKEQKPSSSESGNSTSEAGQTSSQPRARQSARRPVRRPARPSVQPSVQPSADTTHIADIEARYRRVIRALVKKLAQNQSRQPQGKDQRTEHANRIETLHRALKEAQRVRAELQQKLVVAEANLAAAESMQDASADAQRRAAELQEELVSARRRLTRAERLAERFDQLEAQFSWEVLEDVDDADDVNLSRDDIRNRD